MSGNTDELPFKTGIMACKPATYLMRRPSDRLTKRVVPLKGMGSNVDKRRPSPPVFRHPESIVAVE